MKQALGLAVSGTEVRLAQLVLHKGQLRIEALERARLKTTLEFQPAEEKMSAFSETENKDAFGLKESRVEAEAGPSNGKDDTANLEIIYGLLEKFAKKKKIKIGFNVPSSMVNYVRQDSIFATMTQTAIERATGVEKDAGFNWGHETLKSKDGPTMNIAYERQAPTMSLLRDARSYMRGNLHLTLMDTSEIALANMARNSVRMAPKQITVIIDIEDDFTRLIFMRGAELLHVSSIIHESAASPNILEVIYRKVIYEQDEVNIPELSCILLAGRSHRINAKEFFAERFFEAVVDYLASDKFGRFPSNERERETFSEFAVAIALAWKLLQPKNPSLIPLNLLPEDLRDQQEVLKLNYHGYVLLAITGLVAFGLTWQILKIRSNIGPMRIKNSQLELQIQNNQSTVDEVMTLDNQIQRLSKNLSLSDSLSRGHNEFLLFLKKLNTSVRRSGSLWVDEILKQKEGFSISGTSLNRETIPVLAEKLGGASLRRVTRAEASKRKMFQFELEHRGGITEAQLSDNAADGTRSGKPSLETTPRLANESIRQAVSPVRNGMTANGTEVSGRSKNPNTRAAALERDALPALRAEVEPATSTSQNRKPAALGENYRAVPQKSNQELTPNSQRDISSRNSRFVSTDEIDQQKDTRRDSGVPKSAYRLKIESQGNTETNDSVAAPATERLAPQERSTGNLVAPQKTTPTRNAANGGDTAVAQPAPQQPVTLPPATRNNDRYRAYSIEAAVTSTKSQAEQAASLFRKRGLDTLVQEAGTTGDGIRRYRVLVGIFGTEAAAAAKAAEHKALLAKGYCIIGL